MRSVHGNHERFENTYFKKFPGFYVTGDGRSPRGHDPPGLTDGTEQDDESIPDFFTSHQNLKSILSSGCRRDKDGYYWITGRIDDMLNISGAVSTSAGVFF